MTTCSTASWFPLTGIGKAFCGPTTIDLKRMQTLSACSYFATGTTAEAEATRRRIRIDQCQAVSREKSMGMLCFVAPVTAVAPVAEYERALIERLVCTLCATRCNNKSHIDRVTR